MSMESIEAIMITKVKRKPQKKSRGSILESNKNKIKNFDLRNYKKNKINTTLKRETSRKKKLWKQ